MNSNTENPFRLPETHLDEPGAVHGESLYRLFVIGLGTFIDTFLAGVFPAAVNLRRLRWAQRVGKIWLVDLCLLVPPPVLDTILSENIPSIGFTVVQIFGVIYYAKSASGPALDSHKAAGGVFTSNWWTARIGLLFMLVVLSVVTPVVMLVVQGTVHTLPYHELSIRDDQP